MTSKWGFHVVTIKILLVDDEENLLEVSKVYLERINDKVHITTADSALTALGILEKEPFDIIISDYQMPKMDGLQFLSKLRSDGNDIPFIIFTGKGREEVVIQALNLGADFYLQKGGEAVSQFHELINLIDKLYEKKQTELQRKHLLDQQISINKLALTLGETRDLNKIYKTIFQHIYAIMDADTFVVSFVDLGNNVISPGYALINGNVLDITMIPARPLNHKESEVHVNVIESGTPIYMADLRKSINADDDSHVEGDYTKSAVYVPMKIGGETIGVIEVHSYRVNAYSNEDINLLSALANVAANLIQNARLFNLQRQTNIELLEEKNRTQLYLNVVDVIILALDTKANISMINQRGCDILRYDYHELIGKNWIENFVPEDKRKLNQSIFKEMISGFTDNYENYQSPILTAENEIKIISWRSKILYDSQNRISGILSSGIDITDQQKTQDDLVEIKQRYQKIASLINDGLLVLEHDKIAYANERALKIFGYTLDEMMNKRLTSICTKEDRDKLEEFVKNQGSNQELFDDIKFWIFSKDNIKKNILCRFSYSYNSKNKILNQLVIISDITEQTLAEIALKSSEEKYRTTFDSIIDPMHVINENNRFVLTNEAFNSWVKQYNISPLVIGKSVFEVFPFLPDKIKNEYQEVFETGKPLKTIEKTIVDEEEIITETSKIPVFEDNKVVRVITIIKDISQEYSLEQQLLENEKKLRIFFEQSSDGIIVFDKEQKIVDINNRMLDYLGYSKDDLAKLKIIDLIEANELENFRKNLREINEGKIVSFEIIFRTKTMKQFFGEISATAIKFGGKNLLQIIVRDIEQRRRNYEERMKYIQNLQYLSETALNFIGIDYTQNIYDYIGNEIQKLVGESVIVVASYLEAEDVFDVKSLKGVRREAKSIIKLLGKDPYKIKVKINKEIMKKQMTGELIDLPPSLYELTEGIFSRKRSDMIWKALNLTNMYSMIVKENDKIFGSVLIAFRKENKIQNKELVEAFINQSAVALLRREAEEELLQSEERFRKIIQNTPLGIHIYTLNDKKELIFSGYNPAADKILKIKHEKLINLRIDEAFPASKNTKLIDDYMRIATQGGVLEIDDYRYEDKKISSSFEIRAFRSKPGTLVIIFRDITEEVKAKKEEKQYFDDLAFLSAIAFDFVKMTPDENIYEYIAKKVKEIIGKGIINVASYNEKTDTFTNQAIAGLNESLKSFSERLKINPVGMEIVLDKDLRKRLMTSNLRKMEIEFTELVKDKISEKSINIARKLLNVDETYALPFMSAGVLLGAILISIKKGTEIKYKELLEAFTSQAAVALLRRKAEEELLNSEERYRNLVETMNDGLGIDNEDGIFTYVNPKLCSMLGYSSNELIGAKVLDFLDKDNQEIYLEKNENRTSEDLPPYELTWMKKDGSRIPTLISPKNLLNKDNKFIGSFAVITDISERKLAEEQLKEKQKELQEQRDELESFASTIAHDLRGKMQVISLYNSLAETEYSDKIANSIDDMSSFIEDLLLLAKRGEIIGEITDIDLNEIITEICSKITTLQPNLEISIKNLPEIKGDKLKLKQVFENLLMNVVKHAEATTCEIFGSSTKNNYKITIKDNGKGIPEDKLEEIQKSWKTKRYSSFGLLIVLKVIEAHKGKVDLKSEENIGTQIIISLPKEFHK
ncbi:MAG: PAS domain S-box protein [Asgard group archaeon]|nr:PAS domain S-box protein [Asgard group archaeon]